jgi:hypothetical protein
MSIPYITQHYVPTRKKITCRQVTAACMLILMLFIDMLLYLLPRDIPFIDESFFLLASQNKCCATRVRNFILRDRYDHFLLHHHIVYIAPQWQRRQSSVCQWNLISMRVIRRDFGRRWLFDVEMSRCSVLCNVLRTQSWSDSENILYQFKVNRDRLTHLGFAPLSVWVIYTMWWWSKKWS